MRFPTLFSSLILCLFWATTITAASSAGGVRTNFFWSRPSKAKEPKVILITGASAGIGHDMALTMIKRGHIVYGGARRVEKMQDLVDAGGHAMKLDVTDHQVMMEAVKQVIQEQSRIDVLVNNAGMSITGSVEDLSMTDFQRVFDVNFWGATELTKLVVPYMRKKQKGLVVNVSSVAGKTYVPFISAYVGSKHALEGWSDCLRTELAMFNVDVTILEPGMVKSDFLGVAEFCSPDDSVYKPQMEATNEEGNKHANKAHHPSVVTDSLIHATESGQCKRRYVMGYMGATRIFIRSWLGDGVLDFLWRFILAKSKK